SAVSPARTRETISWSLQASIFVCSRIAGIAITQIESREEIRLQDFRALDANRWPSCNRWPPFRSIRSRKQVDETKFDNRLSAAWWALRIGLGAGPIIVGLDVLQQNRRLGNVPEPVGYESRAREQYDIMHAVGVIEIIAGSLVLSRHMKVGNYVVMLWLLGISINLVTTDMFFDLAMRDLGLAVAALALSQLSSLREDTIAGRESGPTLRATA